MERELSWDEIEKKVDELLFWIEFFKGKTTEELESRIEDCPSIRECKVCQRIGLELVRRYELGEGTVEECESI